jgi:hypothetical protein
VKGYGGRVQRALFAIALVVSPACDSTALSEVDPTAFTLAFDPQFASGQEEVVVEATFTGVDDPDDGSGTAASWAVVDWDGGDALEVRDWEFRSNFRVRLRLGVFANAADGGHALTVEVRNHFGTFVGRGEFFVFQ